MLALGLGAACSGDAAKGNAEADGTATGAPPTEAEGSDSVTGVIYQRTLVFVDISKDPTMFVPWDFENRAEAEGVRRILRGWLGRGDQQWDRFADEEWVTPPSRTPWRILPRGATRMVMGFNDVLHELYYQEGIKDLSVQPGDILAEWSGQRGTYRLHEGTAILSGLAYQGLVIDAQTVRVDGSGQPSEWALLVGEGPLYLLIADLEEPGGRHRAWALHDEEEIFWPAVAVTWGETRSFERARRDVPVVWRFQSEDGLVGEIESDNGHVGTLGGEGPILPVLGVYEVAGQVTIGETQVTVRGFLRHFQR